MTRERRRLEEDGLDRAKIVQVEIIVNFNKEVCLQFGLTLHIAGEKDRDLVKRVNVV